MTKLLIVENDTFAATFMKSGFEQLDYSTIHIAEDASTAMHLFRQVQPHACLLDIELGSGPNGIDLARAMRKIDPKVGITFLTSIQDPRLINLKGLQLPLGSKYLAKKFVSGTEQISQIIAESIEMATLGTQLDQTEVKSDLKLSNGQFELVRMIADGLSNREIASQKVMTIKSTENAIARLAKRLKITDTGSNSQRVLIAKRYFEMIGKV
jgi:DNA-binding NarL/FixJ family response regulator